MEMPNIYGHRSCKSLVEVPGKAAYDAHAHGNITRAGKMAGVSAPMLLITDAQGNIIASKSITADITISGTLTASKIIGAVYE